MRRVFATLAIGGALLAASACGTEAPATSSAPASSPSPSPSAAPDYTANTEEVCDKLGTAIEGKTVAKDTEAAVKKALVGKTTKASIDAAALKAMKTVMLGYSDSIRAEAASAQDPGLKAGIELFADSLDKTINGMKKLDEAKGILDSVDATEALKVLGNFCG